MGFLEGWTLLAGPDIGAVAADLVWNQSEFHQDRKDLASQAETECRFQECRQCEHTENRISSCGRARDEVGERGCNREGEPDSLSKSLGWTGNDLGLDVEARNNDPGCQLAERAEPGSRSHPCRESV